MNTHLDIGATFSRIFDTYGKQFGVLIPAALVIFIPVAIINGLALSGDGSLFLLFISALASFVGMFWYQGVVVGAAADMQDGRRDYSIGQLFGSAGEVLPSIIGAGLLAGIAIAIGLILLVIPGLFLATIWAVLIPVIVIERTGAIDAFRRSRALVRGNGWQVFGVIVIIFLAQVVITQIVAAILGDSTVVGAIGNLIVSVLVAPVSALAAAVMFFELRGGAGAGPPADTAVAPTPAAPVPPASSTPPPSPPTGSPNAPGEMPPPPGGIPPQPGGAPPGPTV